MNFIKCHCAKRVRRKRGSAVVVMLALLSIMGIYLAGNVRALRDLKKELKLTEQRQARRLQQVTLSAASFQLNRTNVNEIQFPANPPAPAASGSGATQTQGQDPPRESQPPVGP